MAGISGADTSSSAVSIAVRPFIGCFTICMTKCGNIFHFIGLCLCPFFSKDCCVNCPALYCTGCRSLYCAVCSCCCGFDVTIVSLAHVLSGANPDIVRSVISPAIGCICKVVTKCITYSNGLVSAYRITTVALYLVSCSLRTGSCR